MGNQTQHNKCVHTSKFISLYKFSNTISVLSSKNTGSLDLVITTVGTTYVSESYNSIKFITLRKCREAEPFYTASVWTPHLLNVGSCLIFISLRPAVC
jgi:hypothetical protein